MTQKEMDKLTEHFNAYFHQDDCMVLHPVAMEPHIDALIYAPNEDYPFWKLVTMGASDIKMNAPKGALGNRNEYMMFIDPEVDMNDSETANWFFAQLMEVALFPYAHGSFITFGHSIEWACEEGEEMTGAYIEMPQIIENVGILRCKLGVLKTAVCLQVILLNRAEVDKLLEIGPEQFSNYLYPESGDCHFISERNRSSRF